MVVTSGDMSTEMSDAHQYCRIAFWALANVNAGVVIVSVPLDWLTEAKDGMITSAEELSAFTTVTSRLRLFSSANLTPVRGSQH